MRTTIWLLLLSLFFVITMIDNVSCWGIPSNIFNNIFPTPKPTRKPTPKPTSKPTHRPTPAAKIYVPIPSDVRVIGINNDEKWEDDFKYKGAKTKGGTDGGSGGWEILNELLDPAYDDFYIWYGSGTIRFHGYWSGDYESDPEAILMTQFFKCDDWSDVKISYRPVACNADYNDYWVLYYNGKQKDFYRASSLRYSFYAFSCWRYDDRKWIDIDRVDKDVVFKIQFQINPTFHDDKLGIGDIIVWCDSVPSLSPTTDPTPSPTDSPTPSPTDPTLAPTPSPTPPTKHPTWEPTRDPTQTDTPTTDPTNDPTIDPTKDPTKDPTTDPTKYPTVDPTQAPTRPTSAPTRAPTPPTNAPTGSPSQPPTNAPSLAPSLNPTLAPSYTPSTAPSLAPSLAPSYSPSIAPSAAPTHSIPIIDSWWFDDYIDNEKIAEINNAEIGWLIHNANDEISHRSHMWTGQALTGNNDIRIDKTGIIDTSLSDLSSHPDMIFHGPFWRDMMNSTEIDFITLRRDFECKSQSYVTLWYNVWFCRNNIGIDFLHSLLIDGWDTNITDIDVYSDIDSDIIIADSDLLKIAGCTSNIRQLPFKWHSNYTAYDDLKWNLTWKFELKHDSFWFMITNFTINCDLKYPSAAPTNAPSSDPSYSPSGSPSQPPTIAPSGSPSQPPTAAPSFSPSIAPTTCQDYGYNYSNLDPDFQNDDVIDPYKYIQLVSLGINYSNITSTKNADFIDTELNCTNPDGCSFHCAHPVSCLVSTLNCFSDTGCNLYCDEGDSCGDITINFDKNPSASITVICSASNSCKNLNLITYEPSRAELHCLVESSCENAVIYFNRVSIFNNSNTFIACYAHHSCDGLTMYADGKYSKLRLYQKSDTINIDNGYGYFASLENVLCGLEMKYIEWDPSVSWETKQLIADEFINSELACSDVTINCQRNISSGIAIWNSPTAPNCKIEYLYKDVDVNILHPKFANARCVYVWLYQLVELRCTQPTASPIFTCSGDPTKAPTASPTDYPSYSPSAAPSFSPSLTPTLAPTYSPSLAPSKAPSFSPSLSPTLTPSYSPSIAPSLSPTLAPTQPPSAAPSYSPTQAPTRTPTYAGNIYDTKIDIIYIFRNLTHQNFQWILDHNKTKSITKLSEFIEQKYFDINQLEKYSYYTVYIEKIDGINYHSSSLRMDKLLSIKNNKGENEMHAKSVIEFERRFEVYILKKSQNPKWAVEVTSDLKLFMNNSYINFTVANSSTIASQYDLPDSPFDYAFWALNAFLAICLLIAILAIIHNKRNCGTGNRTGCVPVDNGNWFAMIIYGLQIYDMVSDINLTTEIFKAINNRECEIDPLLGIPCAKDEGDQDYDDPDSVDTFKEYALIIAGILSLTFLIVPYALNIAYAARLQSSRAIKQNPSARTWFETYQSLFISLVVLSGGCYPALNLVSSNIFGLTIFNTGLSSFELKGLSDIRVITTVVTENGPQLLVQIMYSYSISSLTQNTILAFCTSIMSIVASVLNFFINKDKDGQVFDAFYYLELRLKNKNNDKDGIETTNKKNKKKLSKKQKFHIKKRKGIKLDLAKKIVKIYPDVDIAHFEIGYVTLRRDNFVIRVCQHIHEQDLNFTINDSDYDSIKNERRREEAKLRPFKNYCYELFASNREEVENLIFKHYQKLNRNKFEMRYHKEYPTEKNTEKLLRGDQRKKNFRDLIKQGTDGNSIDFDDDDDDEDEDEEDEEDEGDQHLNETGTNDLNLPGNDGKKKKKKKIKQNLVSQHRDQFKIAFDILHQEIKKYHYNHNRDECIPKQQINKFIRILQSNDIHHIVIDDVLDFAVTSGLFIKDDKHDSDLDSSDESQELFQDDDNFIIQQKKIKHQRALQNPVHPNWFITTNDDNDGGEGNNNDNNTQKEGTKATFWSAYNNAKKQNKNKKKKKKKKKKNKKDDKKTNLNKQIELNTNYKRNNNHNNNGDSDEEQDGDDIDTALALWANE